MQNGMPQTSQPKLIRFEPLSSPIGRVIHAGLWKNSTGPQCMRRLPNYCATLTLEGRADYRSPVGGNHTISPGDLILVFPDVPHFYGPSPGHQWTELYVDFDGPAFDLLTQRGMLNPAEPVCHLEPVEYWQRRLQDIMANPLRGGPELVAVRVCQLQQFLVDALAFHKGQAAGAENLAWLNEAKAMLEETSIEPPRSLPEVAEELAMSYEAFRKKFAHLTGMSPGAYRIHRAIDRAAHLMVEQRDLPLKQVATKCGFCNEFYFSKQFKQVVGVPPTEFRRRFFGANRT